MSEKRKETDKETTKPKREHKIGVSTGYETDGVNYWLAPTHVDAWSEIQDQVQALDRIVETVIQSVANARMHVEAQKRKWWDRVYADLGLDKAIPYSFNRAEGKMSPVEPKESQS